MRRLMILTGSLIVILAACTKYEIPKSPCPVDLPTNVGYSTDVQPIFDANCVMCHSGGQSPDLRPPYSFDELIDGGYVDKNFLCESELYLVLIGSHDGRATDEEELIILGWMDEGAEDN